MQPPQPTHFANWTYVILHNTGFDKQNWQTKYWLLARCIQWLTKHVGEQGEAWEFSFVDSFVHGVYFEDPQDAVLFKLSVEV